MNQMKHIPGDHGVPFHLLRRHRLQSSAFILLLFNDKSSEMERSNLAAYCMCSVAEVE